MDHTVKPRVAFFTVCGGGEDYEFLLGSIEHHSRMGQHLVLDTTPPDRALSFRNLPPSVTWVHEPLYGAGWKEFRLRTAVETCLRRAQCLDADVLVYLDSDEFYTQQAAEELFPRGAEAMLEVAYVHWRKDGFPYIYGESEWHPRVWPRKSEVTIALNHQWQLHPRYNGNPEHHPVPVAPDGLSRVRVDGFYRHHLHYALGQKADDERTALDTVDGWIGGGTRVGAVPWPDPLVRWSKEGIRPSQSFL